ncbi:hypothetical protein [Clostridium fungisolvens]|uniref:Uncharacterized protein n=1 Tax=Clostridium fungisolvens TaxID=1604897 RepID=A0A6V8SGP4_9CLOT|nr:hypothetical protein [Clostridium fungisolvens]GFP76379.1 hypothetical protein bsdtw1_02481 [Clostridium fungisolvens]
MNKKISISLPEHVYRLALQKSKFTHGDNNFSGYLRDLICKEFTEDELKNELIELKKPLWMGKTKVADFNSTCQVCTGTISQGEVICYTDLGFQKESDNWVHKSCCRRE